MTQREESDTLGTPGYYPGEEGELGTWVVHVRGGSAFALNAIQALGAVGVARAPGPTRDICGRLMDAFVEASPE